MGHHLVVMGFTMNKIMGILQYLQGGAPVRNR